MSQLEQSAFSVRKQRPSKEIEETVPTVVALVFRVPFWGGTLPPVALIRPANGKNGQWILPQSPIPGCPMVDGNIKDATMSVAYHELGVSSIAFGRIVLIKLSNHLSWNEGLQREVRKRYYLVVCRTKGLALKPLCNSVRSAKWVHGGRDGVLATMTLASQQKREMFQEACDLLSPRDWEAMVF